MTYQFKHLKKVKGKRRFVRFDKLLDEIRNDPINYAENGWWKTGAGKKYLEKRRKNDR
jgi:hypothetical protein